MKLNWQAPGRLSFACGVLRNAISWPFMDEVTQILNAMAGDEPPGADQLLPLVYDELRRLAAQRLAHEAPGQTLTSTALVHEAYLRIAGQGKQAPWKNRGHFFGAAAEAMRRILVENARRKRSQKHGGGLHRVDLSSVELALPQPAEDLVALDDALDQLAEQDAVKAELVKLRYFAGLTLAEAAETLGLSLATAKRSWSYARAWLYREMRSDRTSSPAGA